MWMNAMVLGPAWAMHAAAASARAHVPELYCTVKALVLVNTGNTSLSYTLRSQTIR